MIPTQILGTTIKFSALGRFDKITAPQPRLA
jgi:hypothetical protein